MQKRILITHAWGDGPEKHWHPWLKNELEKKGFEVIVPQMPDTDYPRIEKWIPAISQVVGIADENTYFIGHSMGCQAIARYLESLPENIKVGGAVFVAGFFKRLTGINNDANKIILPWLETPINLENVRSHLDKSIAIFSDDDPYVPLDNQDDFKEKLGSKIIIEHNKGHFGSSLNGMTELPVALYSILEITN